MPSIVERSRFLIPTRSRMPPSFQRSQDASAPHETLIRSSDDSFSLPPHRRTSPQRLLTLTLTHTRTHSRTPSRIHPACLRLWSPFATFSTTTQAQRFLTVMKTDDADNVLASTNQPSPSSTPSSPRLTSDPPPKRPNVRHRHQPSYGGRRQGGARTGG
jgi:hypothetical protein